MATPPGQVVASHVLTPKKRPRLNPARRKSAKANAAGSDDSSMNSNAAAKANLAPSATNMRPETDRKKQAVATINNRSTAKQSPAPTKSSSKQQTTLPAKSRHPAILAADTKPGSLAIATPSFVTGGLIGCAAGAAVILGTGLLRNAAGTDSAVLAARSAQVVVNNLIDDTITSMNAATYSSADALDMLRRTTLAYACMIPGGAAVVERVFREIDMVRKQRGHEVNQVVAEACTELSKAGKRGAGTLEVQRIIFGNLVKLSSFASNATRDIVARNPKLRALRDGTADAKRQPRQPKVPTVKVNMVIRHKTAAAAA